MLTVLATTSWAVDKRMKKVFVDSVQTYLDKVYTDEFVGLYHIEVVSDFVVLERNKKSVILKADVFGETYDFDFGDPVSEIETTCEVLLKKYDRQWVADKVDCL